jgi:hypothetical protein
MSLMQNPAYFFNGYAVPPGQHNNQAAEVLSPSSKPPALANGGARVKGRRAGTLSRQHNNQVMEVLMEAKEHPVKISEAENV